MLFIPQSPVLLSNGVKSPHAAIETKITKIHFQDNVDILYLFPAEHLRIGYYLYLVGKMHYIKNLHNLYRGILILHEGNILWKIWGMKKSFNKWTSSSYIQKHMAVREISGENHIQGSQTREILCPTHFLYLDIFLVKIIYGFIRIWGWQDFKLCIPQGDR